MSEIESRTQVRFEFKSRGTLDETEGLSDAPTDLLASRLWGISCVNRFNRMFALGLWDSRAEQLWLVRHRSGAKRLYYGQHHDRITFTPQLKGLLRDPEQKRLVNEQALNDYLSFLPSQMSA